MLTAGHTRHSYFRISHQLIRRKPQAFLSLSVGDGAKVSGVVCCLVLSVVKGPVLSAHVDSLALPEYLVSNLDHQSKVSHLLTLDARLGRSYKHFILFSPEQNNFDSLSIPTESKWTS